jgi:ATP-dependent helicase HrpB
VIALRAWGRDEFADMSDASLLSSLEDWLAPIVDDVRRAEDFRRLDHLEALSSRLPWDTRRRIDAWAPERLEVPTGSRIALDYSPSAHGGSPVLAVRLQEIFGWTDTPTVNDGRIRVTLHLLSPGNKPVQITQDLRSFWSTTYSEVRKELRARYPKHSWPEDPWTASPVRGARRTRPAAR